MNYLNRMSKKVKSFVLGMMAMLMILPTALTGLTNAAGPVFNNHPNDFPTLTVENQTTNPGVRRDGVWVNDGDLVEFWFYVHNTEPDTTAQDTTVRLTLPTSTSDYYNIQGDLWASNAAMVGNSVVVYGDEDFDLVYEGPTVRHYQDSGWQEENVNGQAVYTGGLNIGPVDGCFDYYQFVSIVFRVEAKDSPDPANLTIAKNVRNVSDGQTSYINQVNADINEDVEFEITVRNDGGSDANGVIIRDVVPNGLNYEEGSAEIINGNLRDALSDDLVNGGVNIGTLNPGTEVRVLFDTTAEAAGTRTNTAYTRATGLNEVSDTAVVVVASQPEDSVLTIDKQVALGEDGTNYQNSVNAEYNDIVRFQIVVTNTGQGLAEQVVVDDGLEIGYYFMRDTTYLDGVRTDDIVDGVELGDMSYNESHTITFNARIDVDDDRTLTNTAYAEARNHAQVSDTADVYVSEQPIDEPRLEIEKEVSLGEDTDDFRNSVNADYRDYVTFSIEVTNTGDGEAENVIVTDSLPADLDYVNGSTELDGRDTDDIIGGVDLGDMNPDESHTVTFVAQAETDRDVTLTNVGYAEADNHYQVNDEAYVYVSGDEEPFLSLEKTVSNSVAEAGDELNYEITIENTGDATANNVNIQDLMPNDVREDEDSLYINVHGDGNIADRDLWDDGVEISYLEPGDWVEISFDAEIDNDVRDGDVLINEAEATDDEGNYAWDDARTTIEDDPSGEAYLRVRKDVDYSNVEPGDRVTFTIDVENTGDETAYDVEIIDYLPSRLRYISGTMDIDLNGDGDIEEDDLFDRGILIDYLEVGDEVEITFEARVDSDTNPGTTLTNEVRAEDRDGHRGEDEASVYVNDDGAYLRITKTVDQSTARPGDRIEYTIVVENTGDNDATDVRIYDELPNYVDVRENTLDIDGDFITREDLFDEDGYIRASRLRDGEEITITFEADIDDDIDRDRTLENVARVTADDGLSDRDVATTFVDVQGDIEDMELSLTKLVRNETQNTSFGTSTNANPGNILEYKVTVTNTGTERINALRLRDVLPNEFNYLGGTAMASFNGNDLGGDFNLIVEADGVVLPDLEPGDSVVIMYKIKTDVNIGDKVTLHNTVQATNDDFNETASASVTFTVVRRELPPTGPANAIVGLLMVLGASAGAWMLRNKFNLVNTL